MAERGAWPPVPWRIKNVDCGASGLFDVQEFPEPEFFCDAGVMELSVQDRLDLETFPVP